MYLDINVYNTYTIDPIAGPFISNILPVIAGSGRSDKNGNLYIDTENSRFGQTIGIFVDGGHYEGIRESLRARRNADSIKYGIQSLYRLSYSDIWGAIEYFFTLCFIYFNLSGIL